MPEGARIGDILGGRYRVDDRVGRGGMSTVYRGTDLQLDRTVAIKVFQSGSEDERWESEVRLLSQLSHPHLVTLHDAHLEERGSAEPSYLILDLVDGPDLQQHLADTGPSIALTGLVVEQVGEALASVHSAGIVHRDLKPGNILLPSSALPPLFLRAQLTDFGIAHLLGTDRITQTGTMVGTAAYTSPEQAQGEPATFASDVYALGLVALECATGMRAFTGTAAESLVGRLTRDPEIPDDLPPEWISLLAAMTSRDPSLRPSAIEAALRARELSGSESIDVPVVETATPATAPMLPPTKVLPSVRAGDGDTAAMTARESGATSSRLRRSSVAAIAAAIVVVLALIVGGVELLRWNSSVATPAPSPSLSPHLTQTTPSTTPSPPVVVGPGNGNGHGKGNGNGHGNGQGNGKGDNG